MRSDFSAGGVVTDAAGRVAIIRTTSAIGDQVWGLPKGHLKKDEDALAAAVRETQEETGLIVRLTATEPAGSIEYSFIARDGQRVEKRVDFYRMEAVGGTRRGMTTRWRKSSSMDSCRHCVALWAVRFW